MKTAISNTEQSLWIGLDSYSELNSNIFYGRDEEIQHLSNDIFHNIQTIIYGPSGTGKTSLIRAGIFKVARANGYLPVYIRLSHDKADAKPYFRQIIDAIEQEAKAREIDIDRVTRYITPHWTTVRLLCDACRWRSAREAPFRWCWKKN